MIEREVGCRMLSSAARSVWAKTLVDPATGELRWLPLHRHLLDAAGVAGELWKAWLSPSLREICGEAFGDEETARRILVFLAGTHDIGKVSPAFAVQASGLGRGRDVSRFAVLTDRMRRYGLALPELVLSKTDRQALPHGLAGAAALREWLIGTYGWQATSADCLAVVVGGHHGIPQEVGEHRRIKSQAGLAAGGQAWAEVRREFLEWAAQRARLTEILPELATVAVPQEVQIAFSGLVIMADWVASNSSFFPLISLDTETMPEDPERVSRGMAELELPGPWRPEPGSGSPRERLRARFKLPAEADARPVQVAAVEAAERMDLPGLMVVEAPMGEGKTEAALLAAEVLADRSGAGGVFVALPTQATTDAMLRRVLNWLSRLPDGAGVGEAARHSVVLSHGRASLNDVFRELQWPGTIDGVAQDEDGDSVLAFVHGWTTGRKKAALADFQVGTVDQLLFVALRARHLALRHLGIARKVVIVDEVHAYDAYMGVYLERALEWLGAYGVAVILLSATLPAARREALCAAYAKGAGVTKPVGLDEGSAYPALTYRRDGAWCTEPVAASGHGGRVALEVVADDVQAVRAFLAERLQDGGCALVVRNTVRDAQETYRVLKSEYGDEVRLVHARYLGHHRVANDASLLRDFGRDATGEKGTRPWRAIVVGTQVVEQSLDVDFDLLVTDIAPVDLVLQRVGRVHRHVRDGRPKSVAVPRCAVIGVPEPDEVPSVPMGSRRVYGEHLLLRSAAMIRRDLSRGGEWHLPEHIAPLVSDVYGPGEVVPAAWRETAVEAMAVHEKRLRDKRHGAKDFRLGPPAAPGEPILGWLHGQVGEADDERQGKAQVRDIPETFEVIVVRDDGEGRWHVPDGDHEHAGELVPRDSPPNQALGRALAGCAVSLPPWCAQGELGGKMLKELQENGFVGEWQRVPALAGQLILPMLDDGSGCLHATRAGLLITYCREIGLEVARG